MVMCLVAHLVLLESSWQGGVHGLCFVVFGPLVCKSLNLELFMNQKIELNYLLF